MRRGPSRAGTELEGKAGAGGAEGGVAVAAGCPLGPAAGASGEGWGAACTAGACVTAVALGFFWASETHAWQCREKG